MKVVRFNGLPLEDKAWLIYEFGNHLCSINYYDHRVHLYSINRQFIELYYNIHFKTIDRVTLAGYNDLDKYAARISLGAIRIGGR